ncbi:MAG: prolyl oligopeptidase family protein, partial [Steroidobacteraceae bacterium]|nr:prolyl oligopeptidase family protein [Steroidobacteraceae bacterium]
MIRKCFLAVSAAIVLVVPLHAEQADDPNTWLEEIEGAKALDWARAENAKSLPVLERDPRFAAMRAEARAILTSPARIPLGSIHAGHVYNFWQDDVHVRGLWRRADVETYRSGAPRWQTLIDFDRLARDERENWVAGQIVCLSPEYRRCMVELSRGGGDTSTWREFDTQAAAFVRGGFALPEAKSDVAWVDTDTLLVGTDWGEGSLTTSGYPRIVKAWRRGTALADARVLFEGGRDDVAVRSLVEQDGAARPFIVRAVSFFEAEYHYAPGLGTPTKLPLPPNADLQGVLDGRAIVSLREPWSYRGQSFATGAVVAYDLRGGAAELVFAPSEVQSVEAVGLGESGLVIQYLENVSGRAARLTRTTGGSWRASEIPLPA